MNRVQRSHAVCFFTHTLLFPTKISQFLAAAAARLLLFRLVLKPVLFDAQTTRIRLLQEKRPVTKMTLYVA